MNPLDVHIDCELNFNGRVTTICRKAGRQLNALGRLACVGVIRIFYLSVLFDHISIFPQLCDTLVI